MGLVFEDEPGLATGRARGGEPVKSEVAQPQSQPGPSPPWRNSTLADITGPPVPGPSFELVLSALLVTSHKVSLSLLPFCREVK